MSEHTPIEYCSRLIEVNLHIIQFDSMSSIPICAICNVVCYAIRIIRVAENAHHQGHILCSDCHTVFRSNMMRMNGRTICVNCPPSRTAFCASNKVVYSRCFDGVNILKQCAGCVARWLSIDITIVGEVCTDRDFHVQRSS